MKTTMLTIILMATSFVLPGCSKSAEDVKLFGIHVGMSCKELAEQLHSHHSKYKEMKEKVGSSVAWGEIRSKYAIKKECKKGGIDSDEDGISLIGPRGMGFRFQYGAKDNVVTWWSAAIEAWVDMYGGNFTAIANNKFVTQKIGETASLAKQFSVAIESDLGKIEMPLITARIEEDNGKNADLAIWKFGKKLLTLKRNPSSVESKRIVTMTRTGYVLDVILKKSPDVDKVASAVE